MAAAVQQQTKGASGRWVVILGAGFVGSRLATVLEGNEARADPAQRRRVLATHRSDFSLEGALRAPLPRTTVIEPLTDQHRFVHADKESWARLPPPHEVDAAVVTFPCTPLECVHPRPLSSLDRL
jgi:hypothetical protein